MTTLINGALPPPKQIRFVNNQGQPPSKRRRINAACLTCRKRKTRCAGEKPVCSTCTKNGHNCFGYNDLAEKKREDGAGPMPSRGDRTDTTDLSNDLDDENMDDGDEDVRRHWKAEARMNSFNGRDAAPRRDSVSSIAAPPGRPCGQGNDWDQDDKSQGSAKAMRRTNFGRTSSYSEDGRSSNNRSPVEHHTESHRMPYFRYFGPTAIVPGYKQMVVNVSVNRDRRKSRGSSFSATSPGSLFGYSLGHHHPSHPETVLETLEDLPVYDVSDISPPHPIIITLIKTFFLYLGCNYPFLREKRILRMVKEKRLEPILVDSMCALAARFSDLPIFSNEQDARVTKSEYGHVFAQRAKAATVDTFPCPSVAAVQACLLMAYEGFGANQDSALWMYLGLAIRMAVDLGLPKRVGIKYQGERDPWYTRTWSRKGSDDSGTLEDSQDSEETLSAEEQLEVEQERTDTFWAVFVLDRVISSGTGRPVTFRDDDFELAFPQPTNDPLTGWPAPFPNFIQIIHLYGRVSDVLNNIRDANDLTEEKLAKLAQMESDLTKIYQKQDPRLHFGITNFGEYVKAGQGTTFILLHFWFHALIIVLHQPTLLTPFGSLSRTKLSPNSRELSMSSAKTIADILAFAELMDPKSFIGNPFTSQPIYIAACAFLMESVANNSEPPSREPSPSEIKVETQRSSFGGKPNTGTVPEARSAKHLLLASAANQNYQRCYKSLQQLQQYWGGVGYILTALDQKSKGIWDCETFTNEEYESAKFQRRGSLSRLTRFENPASPNAPPIAWSLTGTTNSPNSSLTLLYQNNLSATPAHPPPPPPSLPVSAATPPGNMIYDPIRQSLPETGSMFPPAYPQPNVSAVRYQAHPPKPGRHSTSSAGGTGGRSLLKYGTPPLGDMDSNSPPNDSKMHGLGMSQGGHGPSPHAYGSASQHSSGYESSAVHSGSPSSTITDSGMHHQQGHNGVHHGQGGHGHSSYEGDFPQSGLASGSYSYLGLNPINEIITFDSQEISFDALGLPNEMMPPWLEILPDNVLGLWEGGMSGSNQGHMG
ncbi:fungal-specific transcription factor domain-containing protein [Lasiosphaeria miniovina]|uniref:Fungal-specific transcription factor domain-containing protein n=1 Tax=Lasiosphaeria miniovina TaxID=1954250 RepID=A0AA39ZZP7_9PEZI|nr:fungal-specific transcription factor domain-containing protein [Lasiosphaeria miniovina]KAK0706344.1 fungal-specific transcription factor domain-containing protein [Lasiosphaeria miniovina]